MRLICQRCLQYHPDKPQYLEFEDLWTGEERILVVRPCPACLRRESIAAFDEGYWLSDESDKLLEQLPEPQSAKDL